jgi:hypothetical protein
VATVAATVADCDLRPCPAGALALAMLAGLADAVDPSHWRDVANGLGCNASTDPGASGAGRPPDRGDE